jgi:hypothetical protein
MTKHAPHAPGFSHEVRERSIYFVDVQHFSAIMGAVSEMEHQVISSLVLSARLRVLADISVLETQGDLLRLKAVSVALLRKSQYHNGCIVMAERDEFQDQTPNGHLPWRERSPEEHGQAIANLMRYVSAAPL